jgi:2-keto-3-deoxy-L-rhamnonate aldolase RhmA/quercetin dioxygenase-like cupin family protein
MKTSAIQKLRQKLAQEEPVYGLWVTLESASITEMAVALGLDWVVIDAEHGHLDWKEILEHLRAAVRSDTVALVRIAELNLGLIKRALDVGADGVVVPWVESVEQLRQAVTYAHYPPDGVRGMGGERATCWGRCFAEHVAEANEHVLVVPIIETVQAGKNLSQMLEVEGVELFFFGPADYSATAGYPGQWEGPGVAEQLLALKDMVLQAGKHCGVVATSNGDLDERRRQGFQMLGLGLDGGLLLRSLLDSLASMKADRKVHPNLRPDDRTAPTVPLERPPEMMRPDRPEVITSVGAGQKTDIERRVNFECLVGAHNGARNLTTGLVTFGAAADLPMHTHAFTESITLLRGQAVVEVEGRRYKLDPLDNVVIPPGRAHSAQNLSGNQPAVFHIALATDSATRVLVHKFYSRRAMPMESVGEKDGERVNRFKLAPRFEAGPNTAFIDFFNRDLMPGIEMSGGYGLFQPKGRLPAHVHDFDESICIIEGTATCVVEGRRYQMSDGATALQPRGRVHYFVNDSAAPMAMLWVYAGPAPERIVVQERCATVEGNPWR